VSSRFRFRAFGRDGSAWAHRQVPPALPGFDDKIIALYARGMSTRDIQAHVRELFGIEVSPDLVSAVPTK
jgi:hypothetical protein